MGGVSQAGPSLSYADGPGETDHNRETSCSKAPESFPSPPLLQASRSLPSVATSCRCCGQTLWSTLRPDVWSNPGQLRSTSTKRWPTSVEVGSTLAEIGPPGQISSTQTLTDIGQLQAGHWLQEQLVNNFGAKLALATTSLPFALATLTPRRAPPTSQVMRASLRCANSQRPGFGRGARGKMRKKANAQPHGCGALLVEALHLQSSVLFATKATRDGRVAEPALAQRHRISSWQSAIRS